MKFNFFIKTFIVGIAIVLFASCDRDFNELGSSIVGDEHYGMNLTTYPAFAYNQSLGAVQTNNLPVNQFGVYNNPVFGKTTASFVSQLELAVSNPTFYDTPANIVVDSVYLYVPYYATFLSTDTNSGDSAYELDSIQGSGKIKMSIYESNKFLETYDYSVGPQNLQKYYSNQQAQFESQGIIAGARLNNDNTSVFDHTVTDNSQNDAFSFSEKQIKLFKKNADGTPGYTDVSERKGPGMFINLDKNFFKSKIVEAPQGMLFNNNVFKTYFKGLYFKVEALDPNQGSLAMMNFGGGVVTMIYHDKTSATDATIVRRTMNFNLSGNTVNLLNNDFVNPVTTPNTTDGDPDLFLKGGDGSMAIIDLFSKVDQIGYDVNGNLINSPNGISDDLDHLRNPVDGQKWLINEANLTFYVDKAAMGTTAPEPNRVYLYDLNNRRPLVDYGNDLSTSAASTKYNKSVFGGIIKKQSDGRGYLYKVKITNHIRNLVKYGGIGVTRDSTNVRLGLVVTESITNPNNFYLATPFSTASYSKYIPAMSIVNPLGTILYGSNPSVPADKRLKLEIYYTKPD